MITSILCAQGHQALASRWDSRPSPCMLWVGHNRELAFALEFASETKSSCGGLPSIHLAEASLQIASDSNNDPQTACLDLLRQGVLRACCYGPHRAALAANCCDILVKS